MSSTRYVSFFLFIEVVRVGRLNVFFLLLSIRPPCPLFTRGQKVLPESLRNVVMTISSIVGSVILITIFE